MQIILVKSNIQGLFTSDVSSVQFVSFNFVDAINPYYNTNVKLYARLSGKATWQWFSVTFSYTFFGGRRDTTTKQILRANFTCQGQISWVFTSLNYNSESQMNLSVRAEWCTNDLWGGWCMVISGVSMCNHKLTTVPYNCIEP